MKSNKSIGQSKRDKSWQKEIQKKVKAEKVLLDRPDGKKQFDQVIRKALKKKT